MTPYAKLSYEERDMFDNYFLNATGGYEDLSRLAPNKERLAVWNQNKEGIFKVFGEQLILRKPIVLKKGTEGWQEQFEHLYRHQFFACLSYHYFSLGDSIQIKKIFPVEDFISNKLSKDIVLYPKQFPVEEIGFKKGMKTMRVLSKLAEKTHLQTDYEDFRIFHSTLLQEKNLVGQLCLSIHPLDFLTMSDNGYKWSSCMSIKKQGDYCAGVVEMMNSPCVICVYLEGNKPFYINKELEWKWTNKKWRCLFIVENNIITPIKGYPYQSLALETIALDWLAELFNSSANHYLDQYCYPIEKKGSFCDTPEYIYPCGDNENMTFEFHTNIMYLDMGLRSHPYKISKEFYEQTKNKRGICDINYSGPLTCLWCGNQLETTDQTNRVTCCDCRKEWYCDYCGEYVNSRDELVPYLNGEKHICKKCAEKCITTLDGKKLLPHDCIQIIALSDMNILYNADLSDDKVFLVTQFEKTRLPYIYISKDWMVNHFVEEAVEYYRRMIEALNKSYPYYFYIKPNDYCYSPLYWVDSNVEGTGVNHNVYLEGEILFISEEALTTSGRELFNLDHYQNLDYQEALFDSIIFESCALKV